MLSEISHREKTNTVLSLLHMGSKNKTKLINIENRLRVARGRGG